jgi:XTP/dITP diphosphohydrolase
LNKRILIGSANKDKAAELQELLRGLPWTVLSLNDFDAVDAPEETGATFEENAALKARYYGGRFDVPCVADDSGLEVDVLGGQPGVLSRASPAPRLMMPPTTRSSSPNWLGFPPESGPRASGV